MNIINANAKFCFRSDTLENWEAENPVLEKGEFAVVQTNNESEKVKIGDGATPFNELGWWKGGKGESAYEIAVSKGFEGTEEEWLDSFYEVDQDFIPTSSKPQSGTAVAKAISNVSVKKYIKTINSGENLIITRKMESGLYLLRAGSIISFARTVTENSHSFMPTNIVKALNVYVDTEVIISPHAKTNMVVSAFVDDKRSVYIYQGTYREGENLSQSLIDDNTYIYEWVGTVSEDGTEYTYTATFNKLEIAAPGSGSGENGATFIPNVSTDGIISWTNDKGLANPSPVNIKGEDGYTPIKGKDYNDGDDGYSPTVAVSKSGKVTTINITDKNGKKTATINDGEDGGKGADGVSATHSWNGTTLTITSASGTSSANLKGDKGDPYTLTEEDKVEIVSQLSQIEPPKIVSSIEEMSDTTKHYVLDGYIYHNKTVVVEGTTTRTYPNQFVPSTAQLNKRLSGSSGSESAKDGYFVTDFIAVPNFASATPYNMRLNWEMTGASPADDVKVLFYKADKTTKLGYEVLAASGYSNNNIKLENGKTIIDLKTYPKNTAPTATEVAYVKLQLALNSSLTALTSADIANLEITLDAVYEETTTEPTVKNEWVNSGISYAPTFKTDLIGVLGEGNVIYLSDNLPSGTYTLKYGDETYETVGTITV